MFNNYVILDGGREQSLLSGNTLYGKLMIFIDGENLFHKF